MGYQGKSWGAPGASEPSERKAEAVTELKVTRRCRAPPPWGELAASPCSLGGDAGRGTCPSVLFWGHPGQRAGSRVLSQSWGAVASLPLLHQPSRAAPGGVAMSPRGKSPAHRLTSAPGGWQWEGQPQSPQGTRHRARTLSVKPGCTARPSPSIHLTCRMSPAVSLATAMASRTPRAAFPCIPCDVGPVSRVTQHPGALAGRYRGSPAASRCAQPRATWQHCCGGRGGLGWGDRHDAGRSGGAGSPACHGRAQPTLCSLQVLVGLPGVGSHGQLGGGRRSKAWGRCACTKGWGLALGLWAASIPRGTIAKGCWQVSRTTGHAWTVLVTSG